MTSIPKLRCAMGILVALGQCCAASFAEDKTKTARLVERAYRVPTDAEVETYRDLFNRLDIEQSMLDRFGYRCEGFIFNDREPEQFVSIHAVDRELDAVRHVVKRSFTDPDDPLLTFSIEDEEGFADSRTSNSGVFPIEHDRLRKGNHVYFTSDPASFVHKDKVRLTGQDRNFDPVTCSLLPSSSFFSGDISKRRLSRVYGIDKLSPLKVSVVGSSFVSQHEVKTSKGPTGMIEFIEFEHELPVNYEIWWLLKDKNQLVFRTATEWTEFEEMRLPVRIEASHVRGSKTDVFAADIEWKINEDLPKRLFEVSDVTSRNALEW